MASGRRAWAAYSPWPCTAGNLGAQGWQKTQGDQGFVALKQLLAHGEADAVNKRRFEPFLQLLNTLDEPAQHQQPPSVSSQVAVACTIMGMPTACVAMLRVPW